MCWRRATLPSISSPSSDAQHLYLLAKRIPVDAQDRRRADLIALGCLQRELDQRALHLGDHPVVEASLAALGKAQVLVVPGADNRRIARLALQQQSDGL